MADESLTARALNRALLARQHLLRRTRDSVPAVLEHLVGLQAQEPGDPYTALFSRIRAFDSGALASSIDSSEAVRITLMRGTLHLVTARDAHALRPVIQPVLDRMLAQWRRGFAGADPEEVAAAGRRILEQEPLLNSELGKRLAKQWPESDPTSLARIVQAHVPLVQVPPRGVLGKGGLARHAPLSTPPTGRHWQPMSQAFLVKRFLAAFGPASVQDAQAWSGLTKLGPVFEDLGERLLRFESPAGKTLYDLSSAPRPEPDAPAPPRFLPVYENLVLGFRDRSRIISAAARPPSVHENAIVRLVLVDGFLGARWAIERAKPGVMLTVAPFVTLSREDRDAIEVEGMGLAKMLQPGARNYEVRVLRRQPRKLASGITRSQCAARGGT